MRRGSLGRTYLAGGEGPRPPAPAGTGSGWPRSPPSAAELWGWGGAWGFQEAGGRHSGQAQAAGRLAHCPLLGS